MLVASGSGSGLQSRTPSGQDPDRVLQGHQSDRGVFRIQFTFLGYAFRPRKALDKHGRVYVNFSPAVSRDALKSMRQTIRGWRVQLKSDKSLADLSAMLGSDPEGMAAILRPFPRLGAASRCGGA